MTSQEILTKAIQKAIDGGWRGDLLGRLHVFEWEPGKCYEISNESEETWSMEEIIYNKGFAKALWGDDAQCTECGNVSGSGGRLDDANDHYHQDCGGQLVHAWQYHLQMMVIAEDPIKYLGEHLDG